MKVLDELTNYLKISNSYSKTEINNLLNNKQNNLTFISPLAKDVNNNISIDLNLYPSYVS